MSDIRALNAVTEDIIGAAIKVHSRLGPGLLHSVYVPCLAHELLLRGRSVDVDKPIPLVYEDFHTPCAFKIDLVVDEQVIVEVKCAEAIAPVHVAQLLTYLRLTGLELGLIINFNVPVLKQGIRRVVNNLREDARAPVPSS